MATTWPPRILNPTTCRDHAPLDHLGYLQHAEIVAQMKCDGYTQHTCDACGLWAIWRRNDKLRTLVHTLPKFNHWECSRCNLKDL